VASRKNVGQSDAATAKGRAAVAKSDEEIAAYLRERDAVLLDPDLDRLRRHFVKYGRPDALQASDEVMRVAWHKGRSGVTTIPRAERRKSILWLEERGFSHFSDDDGKEPH
jgi:hypothetical protein